MSKLIVDMGISLDGYIDDANGKDAGLHDWVFKGNVPLKDHDLTFQYDSQASADLHHERREQCGAFIVGRRTLKSLNGGPAFWMPTFVLTHRPLKKTVADVHFVTEGILSALKQARAAAKGKDVYTFGSANVVGQYLQAGLVDEIHLAVAPFLMGGGKPLFGKGERVELEQLRVIEGKGVTHMQYRVKKS